MKRGTLAKRLGYFLLKRCRVPFKNQKDELVYMKNTGKIRTKYISSIKEFKEYYGIHFKMNAPYAQELKNAIQPNSANKVNTSKHPDTRGTDTANPFAVPHESEDN